MLKTRFCYIFLLCFSSLPIQAQQRFTLSGTVKDGRTGETLIGAGIFIKGNSTGATSNEYGFYSLTLPAGNYLVLVQYIGYTTDSIRITMDRDIIRIINLTDAAAELREVEVTAWRSNEKIVNAETGVENIDLKEVNKIPVLLGERDIFKSIQLLPGIKSNGDGASGFSVRGGAADQNLILLDEAPVYNASHLMGFFSTFNSDAIKDVVVYKGTQPAHYGGRLSSAIDLRMKDGNKSEGRCRRSSCKGQRFIFRFWKKNVCRYVPSLFSQ
jgi:hypothetical protein